MRGNPRNEQWFLRRSRLQKSGQSRNLVRDFIEDAVTYGTFSSANDFNIYGRTDRSTGSSSCTSIGQKVALCI